MTVLHVTNGDSAAALIAESGVEGEVLAWRDPMHHGRFDATLSLSAQSAARARYLAGPDDEAAACAAFAARDARLANASPDARITAWFEHDLLDQLQLLQILAMLDATNRAPKTVDLICIDAFDGIVPFRGLGQLTSAQIATLYPRRTAMTRAQFDVATAGWAAFCDPDPSVLAGFLAHDKGALPFLRPALRRHLQDFPWHRSGVTRTEQQILDIVAEGTTTARAVFVETMNRERYLFAGDWRIYAVIASLCEAHEPLLAIDEAAQRPLHAQAMAGCTLALTDVGREVQTGARSAFGLIARDAWLGGVHLVSGADLWTWDDSAGVVRRRG